MTRLCSNPYKPYICHMTPQSITAVTQSESSIQQEIVRHYRNTYCLSHHNPRCLILSVPNESNAHRASKLIATGLYPGAADLVLIHFGRPVFVEVKDATGKQSPKQIAFEQHCKKSGAAYHLVRSLEEFCRVLEKL